jgi:hypothetical protein
VKRKEWADIMWNCLKNDTPPNPLPRFLPSIIIKKLSKKFRSKYRAILEGFITGTVDDHFATYLLDDKLFVKYIKLSMGMEQEGWFVGLCNLSEVDTRLFDTACFLTYTHTLKIHFQVLQLQASKDFTKVIKEMLRGMDD